MTNLWVAGVNDLKVYGRWAFAEFRNAIAMEEEYAAPSGAFGVGVKNV